MNGGYFMIDCGGMDLTKGSTTQTVPGLYADCIRAFAMGKPVIACNCTWGLYQMTPIVCFGVDFSASGYVIFTASTLQIIVTSEDYVTINNLAPASPDAPEG